MSSEITINITVRPTGEAVARVEQLAGGAAATPPPMALDQLRAGDVGMAPTPKTSAELESFTATAVGLPPPPMSIEALQGTRAALAAPEPLPAAAVAGEATPPAPMSLGELNAHATPAGRP